jgi:RNA polymerase sigma factor (sigma-70 family)
MKNPIISESVSTVKLNSKPKSLANKTQPNATSAKTSAKQQLKQTYDKLLSLEIDYITHKSFKLKNAFEKIVTAPEPASTVARVNRSKLADLPAYMACLYEKPLLTFDQEQYLFRKFNYLKYLAKQKLTALNADSLKHADLNEIENLLQQADQVRQHVIQSNLRLVVSIARRFADNNMLFDDLIGEGNISLMFAVDKFDYAKGFRFSTYATHAIQRGYYRTVARQQKENSRMILGSDTEQFADREENNPEDISSMYSDKLYSQLIQHMQHLLDDRERMILMARYGLQGSEESQTLKALAEEMGICKERVRQLQNRALVKLQSQAQFIEKSLNDLPMESVKSN